MAKTQKQSSLPIKIFDLFLNQREAQFLLLIGLRLGKLDDISIQGFVQWSPRYSFRFPGKVWATGCGTLQWIHRIFR